MSEEWYDEDDELAEEILTLEAFFDERTMSVHLVENNPPRAKRGEPGKEDGSFFAAFNISVSKTFI